MPAVSRRQKTACMNVATTPCSPDSRRTGAEPRFTALGAAGMRLVGLPARRAPDFWEDWHRRC